MQHIYAITFEDEVAKMKSDGLNEEDYGMKAIIEELLLEIIESKNDKTINDTIENFSNEILTKSCGQKINDFFINGMKDSDSLQYFNILSMYHKHKRRKNLTTKIISKKTGLPELTIKRIENLQVIPKMSTMLKILDAVDLKFSICSTAESTSKNNLNINAEANNP